MERLGLERCERRDETKRRSEGRVGEVIPGTSRALGGQAVGHAARLASGDTGLGAVQESDARVAAQPVEQQPTGCGRRLRRDQHGVATVKVVWTCEGRHERGFLRDLGDQMFLLLGRVEHPPAHLGQRARDPFRHPPAQQGRGVKDGQDFRMS